jgi:hypothetical protein
MTIRRQKQTKAGGFLIFELPCQNGPIQLPCFFNMQRAIFAEGKEGNDETHPQSLSYRPAPGAGVFIVRDK